MRDRKEEKNDGDIKEYIKSTRPQMERKATVDNVSNLYKVPKSTAYYLYKKVLSDEKIPFS